MMNNNKFTYKWLIDPDNLNYLMIVFSIVLGMFLNWRLSFIVLLAMLIWIIFYRIPSVLMIKISLVLIVFIPVSQLSKKPQLAEDLAIIVYGFMILIVLQFIQETRRINKS